MKSARRDDLVTDELVDITAVALYDRGLLLEQAVQHIHDLFRRASLGVGGESTHIGENQGAVDPPRLLAFLERSDRAGRDVLRELETLVEPSHHGVDCPGERADLVVVPDGDASLEIARGHPGTQPSDGLHRFQDNASEKRPYDEHQDGDHRNEPDPGPADRERQRRD